ncbi:hypothetical protein TNCV_1707951 [Trichonephila clavipes]|nr:hypothetical protein TNCV_1707951 [Trichonephila clavipes]
MLLRVITTSSSTGSYLGGSSKSNKRNEEQEKRRSKKKGMVKARDRYLHWKVKKRRVSFLMSLCKTMMKRKSIRFLIAEIGICQVIYSQFGLAIHQNDHQARRRFVEWAQNEIAVVPDFHKRILFSDEALFWLNGYVNKQNCRIWSEANPQVYVETPLHAEKLTVWCALWAGGILLQNG